MSEIQKASWPGWETTRLIGRGSFGAVYEIQRQVFDETEKAALKVISIPQNDSDIEELHNDGYDDESITTTFQSHLKSIVAEYSLMKKMNGCANIVNCDDVRYVQHDDGIGWDIYIKMELLTPLAKSLPSNISEETVINIAKDMCAALELCRKHGIVHRDIKPQNIFISDNGDYKLGDFGIAKTVEKTMGGTKIGTYKYMAPEVYNNQPYGHGADIYSLGLVLYWLLNERRMPFMPLSSVKLQAGMEEEARNRRFAGEQIPAPAHGSKKLQQIVLKACAYDTKERYQTAEEMLMALNDLCGILPPTPPVPDPGPEPEPGPVDPKPKKSSNGKKIIIVIVIGIILFILLRCCGRGDNSQNTDTGKTTVSAGVTDSREPTTVADETETEAPVGATEMTEENQETEESSETAEESTEIEDTISTEDTTEAEETVPPTEAPKETLPVQSNWTEWMTSIPDYVTSNAYDIEKQVLYRKRNLETTSSTEKTMAGWELYDVVQGTGGFGNWSDWSVNGATASDTREVQTELRYRYRDKETTTGTSSSMSGWTLYDTTYAWGSYGSWSAWSTTSATGSDSRQVESKQQYRRRSITTSTEYTAWGEWSGWQSDFYPTPSDLCEVESRTVWGYYYYQCPNCGAHMHGWGFTCLSWAGGCGAAYIPETAGHMVWSTIPWDSAGLSDFGGTGKYVTTAIDGSRMFKHDQGPITQYRHRIRSTQEKVTYGSWSTWSDSVYTSSSSWEVQTRTVYRYRDRQQVPTYYFYRWKDWSDWSANAVSQTDSRQVESKLFYRYRDKVLVTTYYFKRWGAWSDYSTVAATANDTTQVETITQYRYKSK